MEAFRINVNDIPTIWWEEPKYTLGHVANMGFTLIFDCYPHISYHFIISLVMGMDTPHFLPEVLGEKPEKWGVP